MKTAFSIGLISLIFSCNLQKNKLPDYIIVAGDSIKVDNKTTRTNISHKIISKDSVFLELPGFAPKQKPLFSIHDSILLLATSKSDKAYVINLTSMKKIKEYKLRDVKKKYVDVNAPTCACALDLKTDLHGLDFYTNENIILHTVNRLSMINTQGDLVDSILFKSKKFWYSNVHNVPVEYSPITNKIYIFKYCYGCKWSIRSPEAYSYAIESGINIDTKEMEEENIKYPEIYSLFGLGMQDVVYKTSWKNYQYFSFCADHRVYIYNILNKEIKIYGGQSAHSTGYIRTIPLKENKNNEMMLDQSLMADMYFQLVYDDVNKRYYRLFMHPKNNIGNRVHIDCYMQIFDKELSIEDEVKINDLVLNYFAFNGKLYWIVLRKDGAMFYSYTFD